jgi:hypothetical protein
MHGPLLTSKRCLQWIERYPDAQSYACPGLKERTDVPYTTGEPYC